MKTKISFWVSKKRGLLEVFLILVILLSIYLMVILVSFNPFDPSWSQTFIDEPIKNLGGIVGSYLSDAFLLTFGLVSYAIPPLILIFLWTISHQHNTQKYVDHFSIGLRLIGMLALIVTNCGLAALNADDIWYFPSGGIIGSLIIDVMISHLDIASRILILLFVWIIGLTLYTNWSWMVIAEKIGEFTMTILAFFINLLKNISETLQKWIFALIINPVSKRKGEKDITLNNCIIPNDAAKEAEQNMQISETKIRSINSLLSSPSIFLDRGKFRPLIQMKIQPSISQSSCNVLNQQESIRHVDRIGNISHFREDL